MKKFIDKRALFEDRYSKIYGANWLTKGEQNNYFAFRINTQLFTKDDFLSTFKSFSSDEVFFINDTIAIIKNADKNIVTNEINKDQNTGIVLTPSSLIPPILMELNSDNSVLDICAAPGVKTSQILFNAMDSRFEIKLTAVEKDPRRFLKMKDVLHTLFPSTPMELINLDSRRIEERRQYDAILCDVPCSAEGEMIRNKNYKLWSSRLINSYTNSQKAILAKAISLAKPGAAITYSTCTLAPEENEEVIDWALKRFDISLEEIQLPDWDSFIPQVKQGIPDWGIKKYHQDIHKTIRIVPDEVYEGFYVAKIRKN